MSIVTYLNEQAARAERLARGMDQLTTDRLLAMSRDYRQRAEQMSAAPAFVWPLRGDVEAGAGPVASS